MHFPEVVPAFDGLTSEIPYTAIGANTARLFSFPTSMGIEYRIINGRVYITANPVTDPAKIEERLAHFQERAGHYYANWDRLYGEWQQRIEALIADIEAVDVPQLGELDDLSVVTGARGFASNHYLRENFHRCIDLYSKMWHHHTEFLMLAYGAYVVFFEFCKEAFPEMGDQMVARMVAGMDVTMYRPDDELKKLAALAVELDPADLFVEGGEPAKVLSSLGERGEAGARWLAALEVAKDPWFNVSVGDGFYHHHLSWADDLTVPFAALPRYVEQVAAGEDLARPTERLARERNRIANEYRALLGSEEEQAAFDQMLGLCRQVFPYIESHKFYCEHWFTTRFFQKIRAFGQMLADRGVLTAADDVFHLRHTEVEDALADVMLAWASGGTERPALAAHRGRAQEDRRGVGGLVTAAGPRSRAGRAQRPRRQDALGRHRRDRPDLARQRRTRREHRARLRGLAGRRGGDGPGAGQRQRHRADPRGRDPRVPRHGTQLGPGLRQDLGRGVRHRRHDVARGYRRPRVRDARRRRDGPGHLAHQDRRPRAGRRRPRHRHHHLSRGVDMITTRPVVRFADVGIEDVPSVGGKGASLGELLRAGIRVPGGFVVTTAAFRSAVAALDLGSRVVALDAADGEAVAAACAELRAQVESAPLPVEVADAVTASYGELCAEEGNEWLPVAVRSSATSEDSADASFAGLQDTYLWVRGGAGVLDQLRRCWASLYSVESVTYRLRRGISEDDLAMAVVVQRMVDSRSSGVMFTRSPLTGDRSVVCIDASWGLGSAVVSGDVTPDSFVVSKVTGDISKRTVATKTRWHQPEPSGSGVVESEVPAQLQEVPSVSDAEIAELVGIACEIEAHYGSPQDIEWAVSRSAPAGANVFLLQSRPETVWADKDRAKVAAPTARAFDHVFNLLGGKRTPGS